MSWMKQALASGLIAAMLLGCGGGEGKELVEEEYAAASRWCAKWCMPEDTCTGRDFEDLSTWRCGCDSQAWALELSTRCEPRGECVRVDYDDDNCGGCGIKCGSGEACAEGVCIDRDDL